MKKSTFLALFVAALSVLVSCNGSNEQITPSAPSKAQVGKHSAGRIPNNGWAWVENLSVDMSKNSNVAEINGWYGYELYAPNMAIVSEVVVIPPAGAVTPVNVHQWQDFSSVATTKLYPFVNIPSYQSKPWVYKADSGKTFEIRVTWYVTPDNDSSNQSDTATNSFYVTIP